MQPTTTFAWYPVITCHTWVTTENKQCAKNYGANSCLCTQFEYGCIRALHTYICKCGFVHAWCQCWKLCDKMDRAGECDERFLHDADKHCSWNSEADDVGHRSDFSWRDLATVLTTKIAQKVEINCENVLCLENRHDQIWKKIWQQLTPF